MLYDQFNRIHNYLRISLTDACNFRCFYCMPAEDYVFTPSEKLMQLHEIETLAKIFVSLGVNKIRLTGGEPLVRKEAAAIILALAKLPVELTLTTNGARLHEFMDVLEQAGITSLNVSLDTLQEKKFQLMTKRNNFKIVMSNIRLLLEKGMRVKVNAVIMKDVNEDELVDFIAWTKDTPVHVRFIEFMPFEGNRWATNKLVTWEQMVQQAAKKFLFEPLKNEAHETAKGYRVYGHVGTFSVITTMSAPFCSGCNRLRLTADGKMKNCLFSKHEIDLLSALRKGLDIVPLIRENVVAKAKELGGQFTSDYHQVHADKIHNRSMINIGG